MNDTRHTESEYEGRGCMCVLTGCRVWTACPHYGPHCRDHQAWERLRQFDRELEASTPRRGEPQ